MMTKQRHTNTVLLLIVLACSMLKLTLSCGQQNDGEQWRHTPKRAVYHWKTTYAPTEKEKRFLADHKVGRMYIHYFDVAFRDGVIQPEGTVRFKEKPSVNLEVVPTVYITIEALRAMHNEIERRFEGNEYVYNEYAEKIVRRVKAMNKHNAVANVHELQLDCDWTSRLRDDYFGLLAAVRSILHDDDLQLSVTIRLHQLNDVAPPADMGVLMLYNTGNLMSEHTHNSILDVKDARPYLNAAWPYILPLDFAYPDFGWQVVYKDGKFVRLASPKEKVEDEGVRVRNEQADYATILKVKGLAENKLWEDGFSSAIIYHLDEQFLDKFTDEQIEKIYGDR